jgi:DNA (cytosine-5)-methyltransferase 1
MQNEFSHLRQQAGLSVAAAAALVGYNERTVYRWENGEAPPRKAALETLRAAATKAAAAARIDSQFTFIDLFAGIGGLRKGFEAAGGRCIFTSEWNTYSQATYRANFGCDHEIAGDITKVAAAEIPTHDVLLAGFPCQPFSIAGVSKKISLGRPHGFRCDAQGTLFFDVARIIEHHRPRAFLLENVKNLVSHDKGRTFEVIYRTLTEELGYTVSARVIDGRSFVPQHRERIFIVGFREPNEFTLDDLVIPDLSEGPKLRAILHPEDGTEAAEAPYTTGTKAKVADRYTLTEHLWTYLQNYAAKHREKGNGFGFGLVGPDDTARTLSARYYKDGSEVLIRQNGNRPPRRLTPRECARLMGFEMPGGPRFNIPVSDTQAYKQFGNAVVVPVVEAVAKHMRPWILGEAVQPGLFTRPAKVRKVA